MGHLVLGGLWALAGGGGPELAALGRVVGDLYTVVSKRDQRLELWITEQPTGWDLKEKFGWFKHKRARPLPSTSHDVRLLK